jgi:hypothetical protein
MVALTGTRSDWLQKDLRQRYDIDYEDTFRVRLVLLFLYAFS